MGLNAPPALTVRNNRLLIHIYRNIFDGKPVRLLAAFLLFVLAALQQPAWAAVPDGAKLYAQNCAVCHGEAGSGGIGVPLSLPSFQATVSNRYLAATIRQGRPGRVMPAFTQLSDAEVAAIVGHIRTWYHGPVPRYGDAPVAGNPAHGKQLFAAHCAMCHGAEGRGGKGTGVTFSRPRGLPIMPPALDNAGFLASAPDAMIRAVLIRGRAGTPMISFVKAGLSLRDIDDLVAYVRSFRSGAQAPAGGMAGLKPDLIVQSPYDLKATLRNLTQAINSDNFFVGRNQPVEYGLTTPDRANPHQIIVYFCDVPFLNKALAIDPRVGLFLPCRITVVEHQGKVTLMAVNPEVVSRLFNNSELDELCKEMHDRYLAIMQEATL